MSRNIKRILLTTMPRSGTTFMFDFLAKLFDFEKLEPNFLEETIPKAPEWDLYKFDKTYLELKDGQILCAHYQMTEDISAIIENKDILVIHLYRDPRDAILSATLYIKYVLVHHPFHRFFNYLSESEAIAFMISGGIIKNQEGEKIKYEGYEYFTKNTLNWINKKNVLAISYENFFKDPFNLLSNEFEKLDIKFDKNNLNKLIESYSFEKFSGKRKVGKEDKTSHFRKGIVGDYLNYFNLFLESLCKHHIGDDLVSLGYERDFDWFVVKSVTINNYGCTQLNEENTNIWLELNEVYSNFKIYFNNTQLNTFVDLNKNILTATIANNFMEKQNTISVKDLYSNIISNEIIFEKNNKGF